MQVNWKAVCVALNSFEKVRNGGVVGMTQSCRSGCATKPKISGERGLGLGLGDLALELPLWEARWLTPQ
jgi:hypothetical protein